MVVFMLTEVQKAKLAEYKSKTCAPSAARTRLALLFDEGAYTELDAVAASGDSLSGVITAYGYIDGSPVYVFSQDKDVKSGAVSQSHAEKICGIFDLVSRTGVPVVGIYDSCGAFIEDGADALKAYSSMLMWANNLSGVVPQISVIAGACLASSALIACSADFVIATEKADIYITASADKNVNDFNKNGTVSVSVKDDTEAMETARKLIAMLPANNISSPPEFEFEAPSSQAEGLASDIAAAIADADSLIELSTGFGTSSYTALARIGGSVVGIAATNKTDSKITSDDSSKLARFIRTCDAFSIPVLTLIDTEGFADDGNIRDLAKLGNAYAEATTLKISVVTGKAYGSAMTVFGAGNADVTYAYPDSVISPVAPATAVEFLWHDKLKGAKDLKAERDKLGAEYAENEASAFKAAEKNCITGIITSDEAREKVISVLEAMAGKRMNKRLPKKHSNMPF